MTTDGTAFQVHAADTGNARSPSVEQLVAGTTDVMESAERRRRQASTSAASWSDSARYDGAVHVVQAPVGQHAELKLDHLQNP